MKSFAINKTNTSAQSRKMNQQNVWYAILLLNLCILFPSMLIRATVLNLNSTANLFTSWINYPDNGSIDVYDGSSEAPFSFSPILYRESSNGSQFVCGFYSISSNEIPNYVFGILIFKDSFPGENKLYISRDPQLIWSANRDRPVKINATLEFSVSGDLILKDSDDTLVWSTYTAAKEITGLTLSEKGNLLLHEKNDKIVWQSFDHPTDTLLPGQRLASGQSLLSYTSIGNVDGGLFSIVFQDGVVWGNVSNPPQNYFWRDSGNFDNFYVRDNFLIYNDTLAPATPWYMRLDSDGHLRIYTWFVSEWDVAADVLTKYIGECGYPLVCGKYGICSSGKQCSCPGEANNQSSAFVPVARRYLNLGCEPVLPINCSNSKSHTLLELKNTSYLDLDQSYESSKEKIKLNDCQNMCLKDCSCKAAIYATYSNADIWNPYAHYSKCFLVSEVYSIKNIESIYDAMVFLKVEENITTLPLPHKRAHHARLKVGTSIGVSLGLISLFAFLFLFLRKKNDIEEFDDFSFNQVPWTPTRFSYDDLKAITNNFFNKLGQGGFGTVFEGTLNDGTKVAVKRLDGLREIKKSFLAEVETIGSIHHVNLVRLIGFCAEKSHGLLVYEYMPKGSLDKWIFQTNKELSLKWEQRKKIILDIAKGLTYLHEECRCKIFHLDIKPQNILLDANLNAKVSDFGLAKLIDKDQSQVMTTLRGTPGYLAPEWLSSIITEKVDVYSFGVVVLEILCGRKNVDRSRPEEDMHLLPIFKKKTEEGRLEDMIDTANEDMQAHVAEILKMMKIVKLCLLSEYSSRPLMSIIVNAIENSLDVNDNLRYNSTNLDITITPGDDNISDITLSSTLLSGPR